MTDRLGLTDTVIDLGEVAPSGHPQGVSSQLPSHWEGLANAVMEALASGLPVVTTAVGGHPEVLVDDTAGALVPPRDVNALTGALDLLLSDPERRAQCRKCARRAAERIGDHRSNARRLATVLHIQ